MRKVLLIGTMLFSISCFCFATPDPSATTTTPTAKPKSSATSASSTQSTKVSSQSNKTTNNNTKSTVKPTPSPNSKTTTPSKHATNHHSTKTSHHRHSVPQIRHTTLHEENYTPLTPPEPVEAAPKQASIFDWFKQNSERAEASANGANTHTTSLVHKTVANLQYSSYRFGGNRYDPQHGVYMLDCSAYIDHILNQSSPRAYSILAQWSGTYKPNSEHYYNFFNRLPADSNESRWNKVANSQQLKAGDILVFRYKNARGRSSGSGHVMMVMDRPVGNANVLRVRVADSAETGHSGDTRGMRASGIGIGTLLLRINSETGQPYAFAWRENSPWNARVNIAMGRPPSV